MKKQMKATTNLTLFFAILLAVSLFAESNFTVGGAVRYNLFLKNYESDETVFSDGQFTWDTWRLNISGQNDAGVILDFEYRFVCFYIFLAISGDVFFVFFFFFSSRRRHTRL